MLWFLPLALAAAGALADKDKPLRGAALGAAAGLTGGATLGAGGLLGAGTAGAAGTGAATQAGLLAAQEAGLGATSLGWGGATTGMQGAMNAALGSGAGASTGGLLSQGMGALDAANKVAKPAGQAMQVAQLMTPQELPMQPQQPAQLSAKPADLGGLLQQGQQARSVEEQEALRRRQMIQQYSSQIGRF